MGYSAVAEGPVRITKATVDGAWKRRAKGVRLLVKDADCRGLVLVVNPTSMVWRYDYRPRGTDAHTGKRWPVRSLTLGNPETHSPDEARAAADKVKGQTAAGGDPAAEKRAAAEAERRRRALTLGRLLDAYEGALPKRPKLRGTGLPSARHVKEEMAQARAAVAAMGAAALPVAELAPAPIRAMLATDAARPATARARFGALSRFLDWAQDDGHIEVNPCALLARSRRPRAPQARAHFLTVPELARLWRAADGLAHPVWRDLVRFLVAVPCRRSEAAGLDWAHVDLDAAEWRQPGRLTKNREPHRLHLHPLALDLLRRRWTEAGRPRAGRVFPSPEVGGKVDTFTDLKTVLETATELTGWRWHDFRRSFATALGEAGTPEAVADAVLNHKQAATRGGVAGVYQRATRWPEQVRAMQAWGELLAGGLAPKPKGRPAAPGGNVVALVGKRRRAG